MVTVAEMFTLLFVFMAFLVAYPMEDLEINQQVSSSKAQRLSRINALDLDLRIDQRAKSILWDNVKSDILEDHSSSNQDDYIGKCANAYDLKHGLTKLFVIDRICSNNPRSYQTIVWRVIEFYPTCCKLTETTKISPYYLRECSLEERYVIISDSLRQQNESYEQALSSIKHDVTQYIKY